MAAGARETGFQQGENRSWLHVYNPDTLVDVLRILSVTVHMKGRSKMEVANKRPHVPDVTNTATRVDYSFPAAIACRRVYATLVLDLHDDQGEHPSHASEVRIACSRSCQVADNVNRTEDDDTERATKKRKLEPSQSYNASQPTGASFAEVLERIKEESNDGAGACISTFQSCLLTRLYRSRRWRRCLGATSVGTHKPANRLNR